MKYLSSSDNKLIKEAASLSEKKYRDKLGLYMIEGPNIVSEALGQDGAVRRVFVRAEAPDSETETLIAAAEKAGTEVYRLPSELFSRITDARTPQSVAAQAVKPGAPSESLLEGSVNVLVLDRLQDPGNVGTLIRTAEAMGFGAVLIIKGTADPWQPKAVRSSAGSLLRLPVFECADAAEAIELLGRKGKKLYTAAAEGQLYIQDADLKENAAVVIGNEGAGASKELKNAAMLLSIPMEGRTESLNAAAAGAIIMYESLRQKGRKQSE